MDGAELEPLSPEVREALLQQVARAEQRKAALLAAVDETGRYQQVLQAALDADAELTGRRQAQSGRSTSEPTPGLDSEPARQVRFGRPVPDGPTATERIATFYRDATTGRPGEFISFSEAADAMPDLDRDNVGRTCRRLADQGKLERQGSAYRARPADATAQPDAAAAIPSGDQQRPEQPTDLGEARRARSA